MRERVTKEIATEMMQWFDYEHEDDCWADALEVSGRILGVVADECEAYGEHWRGAGWRTLVNWIKAQ